MVGEDEAGRGVEDSSSAISPGPNAKFDYEVGIISPATSSSGCHKNDVAFGAAFDAEIAVYLTEFEELVVIHPVRRDRMNHERRLFDGVKHFCHGGKVPKWRRGGKVVGAIKILDRR